MSDLPNVAISIRQPWAWAIEAGYKSVENRDTVGWVGSLPKQVCIHASAGMTRDEYKDAADFMARIGVICPPPADLVRGAIIATATITQIVTQDTLRFIDPWFGGPYGLILRDITPVAEPIPVKGALGIYTWRNRRNETTAHTKPWMSKFRGG